MCWKRWQWKFRCRDPSPTMASTTKRRSSAAETGAHGDEFARLIGAEIQARAQDLTPDTAARDYIATHFVWPAIGEKLHAMLCATARGN